MHFHGAAVGHADGYQHVGTDRGSLRRPRRLIRLNCQVGAAVRLGVAAEHEHRVSEERELPRVRDIALFLQMQELGGREHLSCEDAVLFECGPVDLLRESSEDASVTAARRCHTGNCATVRGVDQLLRHAVVRSIGVRLGDVVQPARHAGHRQDDRKALRVLHQSYVPRVQHVVPDEYPPVAVEVHEEVPVVEGLDDVERAALVGAVVVAVQPIGCDRLRDDGVVLVEEGDVLVLERVEETAYEQDAFVPRLTRRQRHIGCRLAQCGRELLQVADGEPAQHHVLEVVVSADAGVIVVGGGLRPTIAVVDGDHHGRVVVRVGVAHQHDESQPPVPEVPGRARVIDVADELPDALGGLVHQVRHLHDTDVEAEVCRVMVGISEEGWSRRQLVGDQEENVDARVSAVRHGVTVVDRTAPDCRSGRRRAPSISRLRLVVHDRPGADAAHGPRGRRDGPGGIPELHLDLSRQRLEPARSLRESAKVDAHDRHALVSYEPGALDASDLVDDGRVDRDDASGNGQAYGDDDRLCSRRNREQSAGGGEPGAGCVVRALAGFKRNRPVRQGTRTGRTHLCLGEVYRSEWSRGTLCLGPHTKHRRPAGWSPGPCISLCFPSFASVRLAWEQPCARDESCEERAEAVSCGPTLRAPHARYHHMSGRP